METRKIIGWILFYGYTFSWIFQIIWLVLSVMYALENQDIICADGSHHPHSHPGLLRRQHQKCTDCVDQQSLQFPAHKGRRSQYHYQHRPDGTRIRHGSGDNDDNVDENLDLQGNSEFWKYPRQFFMVNEQAGKTGAFLCSVFVCHFHPLYSNTSENFRNDSENFITSNSKKTKSKRPQAGRDVHIFDLRLGDDNYCKAPENFNDNYGYQCDTQGFYMFTFQVRPNSILSVDCRGKMTNHSLAYEDVKEECFPGKNGIALFNVTEVRRDLQRTNLEPLQMKENIASQLVTSQSELEAKLSPGTTNEVKFQHPFQNNWEPLKAEVARGENDVKPLDPSNDSSNGVGHSILMVIRKILVSQMVNYYGISEEQDATEDSEEDEDAVEWVELTDNNHHSKCSEEFFFPTIAVYIEALTVFLTVICTYLSHKHCFRTNYRNHSFLVGCMICTIISGTLSMATWPDASLKTFKHEWAFWANIVCVLYVLLAVAVIVIYQLYTDVGDVGRDYDTDASSPLPSPRSQPLLGRIPFYHPPRNPPPTRRAPRRRAPPSAKPPSFGLAPKSGDDPNTGLGGGPTCTTSGGTSESAAEPPTEPVRSACAASIPLLGGAAAVPTTTYGATNIMVNGVNGVDHTSQSDSLTTDGSPINLMFYSNPSLASSYDAECNGYMSGREGNMAPPEDDGRPKSDEYFEASASESTPRVDNMPNSNSL